MYFFYFHITVAPRYNEDPVITNNIWKPGRITYSKICGNKHRYNKIPAITNWFWGSPPPHNLPRYRKYFVLPLPVSKNDMMQMAHKPNTTLIGEDRETF